MAPVTKKGWRVREASGLATVGAILILTIFAATPRSQAQSGGGQTQTPPSAGQSQDIPDAPSTVQPPEPKLPSQRPDNSTSTPPAYPGESGAHPDQKTTPPPMPPVETLPAGSRPRNQVNPKEDLYTITVAAHVVQIPVMVKDSDGRPVDGLLPKDFTVLENGKKQTLTFFSSDPFELSVAIVLDTNIADVVLQQVNQTYSSLIGAFSPYDEVALYTYSSTVTQVTDFSGRATKLTAALNQLKTVRGRNNGPPVLGGPLGPQGPSVNGMPVGGPPVAPVITPPRESHVLNDAILRAALDLSKRDRTRRKVIFVISDGQELGSRSSYRDVLRVLQTHDIQVKAVVVDTGALPGYRQLEKLHHIPKQGFSEILPRYVNATGGGQIFTELTRNSMEEAYGQITSEARNQYTLAYSPKATTGPASYRSIEVLVDKKGLNVYAKPGYYPVPTAR